ncbi:MAG: hypothetical protein K5751_01065 [Treponemataceae bacterium]|nr:hypothetical protein [Treponemataceae bacterium]
MDIQNICTRVYELVLAYAEKNKAPIAYVNVEAGFDFEYDDSVLWETFNKIRWDTVLSSAELMISRKRSDGTKDESLRVVSISTFEEDNGESPEILVENGLVYPLEGEGTERSR